MSAPAFSLEEEVHALRCDNYNVAVVGDLLIARDIPYVTNTRTIQRGVLAFPVEATPAGLLPSGDHTAYFFGDHPCDASGTPLNIHAGGQVDFDIPGVGRAKLRLSRKKGSLSLGTSSYISAREKLEAYVTIITASASRIDPVVTAKTGGIPPESIPADPFLYPDSASARVGIGHLTAPFRDQRIGIVGLGGTGSYILDLVSKTPVPEIHLFDADIFRAHNAFRAPGAAGAAEVGLGEPKAARFSRVYGNFRTGIIPHTLGISRESHELLQGLTFAFIAVDNNPARLEIVALLTELAIPFVDVGLNASIVQEPSTCLIARIRTTFWDPSMPPAFGPAPQMADDVGDAYSSNIQIAELNSINAAFAVIRWKKHLGFYQDWEGERETVYDTNTQTLARP